MVVREPQIPDGSIEIPAGARLFDLTIQLLIFTALKWAQKESIMAGNRQATHCFLALLFDDCTYEPPISIHCNIVEYSAKSKSDCFFCSNRCNGEGGGCGYQHSSNSLAHIHCICGVSGAYILPSALPPQYLFANWSLACETLIDSVSWSTCWSSIQLNHKRRHSRKLINGIQLPPSDGLQWT